MNLFKKPEPIQPGAVPPPRVVNTVLPEDEFKTAFEDFAMAPLKPWQVYPVGSAKAASEGPSPALVAFAERVMLDMFSKQDSIVCVPDELAERAWELAEAFARAYAKRVK